VVRGALVAAEVQAVREAAEALVAPGTSLAEMAEPVALRALAAAAATTAPGASLGAMVALAAPVLGERGEALVGLRVVAVRGGRCCRRGRMLSVRPGSFGRRVPSPSGVRGRRPGGPGVLRLLRLLGVRRVPAPAMSGGLRAAG